VLKVLHAPKTFPFPALLNRSSLPPVTIHHQYPKRISVQASIIALAEDAQADTGVLIGTHKTMLYGNIASVQYQQSFWG